MTQRPGRRCSRRNRDARRESEAGKPLPHIAHQPALTPEQMRDPADVEPQPIAIHFDQRRPASGPAREPLHQRRISVWIGRNRDQRRVERARIGQPGSRPRTALGRGFGCRMNDQPVRALDGEDNRRVRR